MGKSKFIQKSVFLAPLTKKLISFTLLLLLVMIIAACKKNKPLSDREVTINLAGDWEFNKEHLFGTWKPYVFAYTDDGKQFSGKDVISSNYTVEIIDWSFIGSETVAAFDRLRFDFFENYVFSYLTPSYFVSLDQKKFYYKGFGIQYDKLTEIANSAARYAQNFEHLAELLADFVYIELPYEQFKIHTALEKAYSFVIRNDDLFIYFTGIENINLLILKKN